MMFDQGTFLIHEVISMPISLPGMNFMGWWEKSAPMPPNFGKCLAQTYPLYALRPQRKFLVTEIKDLP
jgi:hypothetical protein